MPFGKMDDPQTIWINLRAVQYYSAENGTDLFHQRGEPAAGLPNRSSKADRAIALYITLIS
ncbi:MAG: hypothetical protein ACLVJX_10110 [Merdibacter sp.]